MSGMIIMNGTLGNQGLAEELSVTSNEDLTFQIMIPQAIT